MPTTRRRHQITETEAVAEAIDAAAMRWPEDAGNRAELLRRLIEQGHRVIAGRLDRDIRARRAAVRAAAGILNGTYPPGYRDRMRSDWPE